jgi:hypothetical protein
MGASFDIANEEPSAITLKNKGIVVFIDLI